MEKWQRYLSHVRHDKCYDLFTWKLWFLCGGICDMLEMKILRFWTRLSQPLVFPFYWNLNVSGNAYLSTNWYSKKCCHSFWSILLRGFQQVREEIGREKFLFLFFFSELVFTLVPIPVSCNLYQSFDKSNRGLNVWNERSTALISTPHPFFPPKWLGHTFAQGW